MNILVTGAAGFVGTNLAIALTNDPSAGFKVTGVDSLTRPGSEENLRTLHEKAPGLTFLRREIEDVPGLIPRLRPDIIFHFAAQVAVTSSVENPVRDFRINAEGSFLIARAASDLDIPVIYTSTNKVYGDNVNHVPIRELETRYDYAPPYQGKGLPETFSIDANHHTPYGISKLVGELYVREFGGIANRCSCMYGPNQFGILDQGWLSHLALNKLKGRPTTIYGDGKQVRDILHIRDVVDLMLKQAEAMTGPRRGELAGQVYNVGGGPDSTLSLLELCRHWDIEPAFADWRPADQKVFYCDTTKARETFGWQPQVGVEEGIADLYQWTATQARIAD